MNALAIMLVSLCSKYSLLGSWHNLCQIIFFKYFFKVFFFLCVCVQYLLFFVVCQQYFLNHPTCWYICHMLNKKL